VGEISEETPGAEAILDAFVEPVFAIDESFRTVRWNRAALDRTEMSALEIKDQFCYNTFHGRDSKCPYCPLENDTTFVAGQRRERIIHTHSAGAEKTYRLRFYRMATGKLALTEIIEDITTQRERQEEDLRMENLAALGTMISGITHELNNPLTGMGLNLQNLEANISTMDMQEVLKRLTIIRKDLQRASRIVQDILSFSRPGQFTTTRADLVQIIEKARANTIRLYPVLSRRVRWEIPEIEHVILQFNPERVERLFINLFRNSLQALDYAPGTISVEVRMTNRWVRVIVEDDAGGIPPEVINQIFTPFYSKSRDGQGSGLGLTICLSIVREHQGRMHVRSQAGRTRFFISFPLRTGDES